MLSFAVKKFTNYFIAGILSVLPLSRGGIGREGPDQEIISPNVSDSGSEQLKINKKFAPLGELENVETVYRKFLRTEIDKVCHVAMASTKMCFECF